MGTQRIKRMGKSLVQKTYNWQDYNKKLASLAKKKENRKKLIQLNKEAMQ